MQRTLAASVGIVFAAACTPVPGPAPLQSRDAAWKDTGTPPATVERVTRYYVDEQGGVWNDRGQRQETPPRPTP